MARYTYTGRLTNFARGTIPAGAEPRLYVKPVQPGYGGLGLLADRRIPVTLESDGSFSVRLEASNSVRPEALYELICEWLDQSGNPQGFSRWALFRAPVGGGNIADLVDLAPPSGVQLMYGYGPPPSSIPANTIYLDISGSKPVIYGPEGGQV